MNLTSKMNMESKMIIKYKSIPKHILMKLLYMKIKIKAPREKRHTTLKGVIIKLTADFSSLITNSRRQWNNIF